MTSWRGKGLLQQKEAEADFEKVIDRALAMGMSREDILETVTLLLDEK